MLDDGSAAFHDRRVEYMMVQYLKDETILFGLVNISDKPTTCIKGDRQLDLII